MHVYLVYGRILVMLNVVLVDAIEITNTEQFRIYPVI